MVALQFVYELCCQPENIFLLQILSKPFNFPSPHPPIVLGLHALCLVWDKFTMGRSLHLTESNNPTEETGTMPHYMNMQDESDDQM